MLSIGKTFAEIPRDAGINWDEPFQRATRALGVVVLAAGILVLVGWLSGIEALTRIASTGPAMKANSALGFVLLGALLLAAVPMKPQPGFTWRTAVAILVALLGVGAGAQYSFGLDVGIDQFFAPHSDAPEAAHGGRISELSAVGFAVLGCAFLIVDAKDERLQALARFFALVVFNIGYVGLVGHLFEAQQLYRLGDGTALAPEAAALFVVVAVAFLFARPTRGIARVLTQDDVRGMLLRRLWPTVLVIAPLLGWLQMRATLHAGTADSVMVVLGSVLLVMALIWWSAKAIRDAMTARDHAEANVKASEERLQWALQAAGGGAWDWDLRHDKVWWSPELYELWQIDSRTRMHFENSMELIDPRDRDQVAAVLKQAVESRSTYRCEFRLVGPHGAERWMESRGRASYDAAGQAVRLLGISIDITAQKRVELSLREANQALERSNIELQRFAYVASHDLQTPLRTVTSFAELLQTRYANALPPEAKSWLERILGSVEKLQSLVGDLLQYSRVDSHARPFAPVSMDETLASALQLLEGPLRDCGAAIERSSLPTVRGDATQLAGVWLNLLGNAVKYRRQEPLRISVCVAQSDREWLFSVADNGIGIEARHCERIFEMFERLHSVTDCPGTGMGLAICRRVIQRHGGRIWVESMPGKGSTFLFTLPRATTK